MSGVRILGTGSYVPEEVVTNEDLAHRLGCTAEWISVRTGILERRYAPPYQMTSDLCTAASRRCIEMAGVDLGDIDLLVLATCTPDAFMPATGCMVQHQLGLNCPVVDLQAACAGFVYALVTAATYISSGASDLVLVAAGDCLSRACDPDDNMTAPLFGDGAGAVLLGRADPRETINFVLGTDGSGGDLIRRNGEGCHSPRAADGTRHEARYFGMDGRAVFRWAVGILPQSIREVLAGACLAVEEVDLFIPHQANLRIIRAAAEALGVPPEKFFTNLERYGNTSAASVPLALDEAVRGGRVRKGDLVLLSGFGSGLAWGSVAFRW